MHYRNELYHFGVMGRKWGIRRYQNPDGSLTEAGKQRYSGSDAKKNFVDDYKHVYSNNPVSFVKTPYGPARYNGNASTYGEREMHS